MNQHTPWNLFQKIGFRFFFSYTLLYAFPFPIDAFSFLQKFTNWLRLIIWGDIVPFVGTSVFGVTVDSVRPITGSGDQTYDYILIFTQILLAISICIIWSIVDRKRKEYFTLLKFLVVYISYYVMFVMLTYGSFKVIPLQFPAPSLSRLLQPYGDSSPMGIAWTFMGASGAYTIFSGIAEVTAGILLIFRRTRTLGSLVGFGVMLNVFMMNMCYDIPVKLYSFHLVLFSLFIFLQDWKRLFAVFFTKATIIPRSFPQYFKKRAYNIAAITVKVLLVGYIIINITSEMFASNAQYGPNTPKPPMYGIYNVTSIVKNNDTIPLLITNDSIWKRIVFQRKGYISFFNMKDRSNWYSMKLDSVAKTMQLKQLRDSTDIFDVRYSLKDSILTVAGMHNEDSIIIKAKQYDLTKFRLINRGFNWINERPFNR